MIAASLRRSAFPCAVFLALLLVLSTSAKAQAPGRFGYYRDPAVHGSTVVFTAEGDLWTVPLQGGVAQRLTSAPGMERNAVFSPDGSTVAFSGSYEGPREVYTMPLAGGVPQRRTWDGDGSAAAWHPDGRLLIRTSRYTPWRSSSLVLLDAKGGRERVPLAQGSEAAYSPDGKTLFFTRLDFQGSQTKRYQGGLIQSLWRWDGTGEAVPITGDYLGTSRSPRMAGSTLVFESDRTGVMNVWTVDRDGKGAKQLSHQKTFDVEGIAADGGHVVYACAGELWRLDVDTGTEHKIPVSLQSDFDQLREHWVQNPASYVTDVHPSPDGSRVLFTARGEVFSVPAKPGRIAKIAGESSVRFRSARYLPDGKGILALSTATGETEFWRYPATGEDKPEQWTKGATVLRWDGFVSPDGKWLAHTNKDQELWLLDTASKQDRRIAQSMNGDFGDLAWSPDSRWLAFTQGADNQFSQIKVMEASSARIETLTTDRYDSGSPVWSADGKWIYFLSSRSLQTSVRGPWGPREPKPHFNQTMKVYELALLPDERSPFLPPDELHPDTDKDKADDKKAGDDKTTSKVESNAVKAKDRKGDTKDKAAGDKKEAGNKDDKKDDKPKPPEVKIDFTGITERINEIPVPPGNYSALQSTEKRLCWMNATDEPHPKQAVQCFDIANKGDEPDTLMADTKGFEISTDRKKILLAKGDDFFVVDSDAKGAGLGDPKVMGKARLDLSHWSFTTTPREEFRGLFLDAWRLERDYFYDRNMHGVNWVAMRERYLPLVDRVADRDELNEVIAQMVSELSALHTFVGGGDQRRPALKIDLATLGADLQRNEAAGGYTVTHVYGYDTDLPGTAPPLQRPESRVHEGETITEIDGVHTLDVPDEGVLLRGKADTEVLLQVKGTDGKVRGVLVKPLSAHADRDLRYAEWEVKNRKAVDSASSGAIGYVHLRAMGSDDIDQWTRDFYPVYKRSGLIVDVRHNNGGNIDSWLLTDLLRKEWMFFQPRVGNPDWNMQSAFRGHIVVLCDQETASDGEAFAEGFKRLKLGTVVGMRTWGGEIWLSFGDTAQADNGVASAAETGVYADGKWLIEGHGVDPDQVVDNLPHASFTGTDAQLDAAIHLLQQQITADPRPVPQHPPYPDKSFKY